MIGEYLLGVKTCPIHAGPADTLTAPDLIRNWSGLLQIISVRPCLDCTSFLSHCTPMEHVFRCVRTLFYDYCLPWWGSVNVSFLTLNHGYSKQKASSAGNEGVVQWLLCDWAQFKESLSSRPSIILSKKRKRESERCMNWGVALATARGREGSNRKGSDTDPQEQI